MSCGIVCSNMGLKAGKRIGVKGEISAGAKSFVLNLGKDQANLVLHFNPRFDVHGDVRTIVCNSLDKGEWGAEQRESAFPFQEGTNVEIFITHDPSNLTIALPNNHQFKFPNRLGLQVIDFLNAEGDFTIKSIQLE